MTRRGLCSATGEGEPHFRDLRVELADNGVFANSTIRICPGRYYADASLFINIAMILHVFDISPPLDKDGKAMTVNPQMTNGLLSCVMTPQVWRYLQITHTKLAVRQVS